MMMIRACPSLLIAAVMKDPYFNAGSQARHLTVLSSFLFFCRLLGNELQSHFV